MLLNWKYLPLIAALASGPTLAYGQDQKINIGEREYLGNCAVCHGSSGKGDGPLAEVLTQEVPDLTVIQEDNMGAFPFNEVYEVIDGRAMVEAHGTREMPVWGQQYRLKAEEHYPPFWPYEPEDFIRGRIIALTAYIYELQD